MKHTIAIIACLGFTALPALAQDNNSVAGAASQSNNTANQVSASGAIASGGAGGSVIIEPTPQTQTITTKSPGTSVTRIENAPALGGLALGGGHPCAYSPATLQASIIGGAAGIGGMKIDDVCMLMVSGAATGDTRYYTAANYLMAGDRKTCKAMYNAGLVADCVDRKGVSYVKASPTVSTNSGLSRYKRDTGTAATRVSARANRSDER